MVASTSELRTARLSAATNTPSASKYSTNSRSSGMLTAGNVCSDSASVAQDVYEQLATSRLVGARTTSASSVSGEVLVATITTLPARYSKRRVV